MTSSTLQQPPKTLLIACGALAREILLLIETNNLHRMEITCLPASLHNHPEKIPEAMRAKIREHRDHFDRIVAVFADCGTGGALDAVLKEEGVERIFGAHCYEFYTGTSAFTQLAEQELGSFYLTDFIVRQFDTLIIQGLGIDRHPELLSMYFGNYKRVVYLAQVEDEDLVAQAKLAAEKLGLAYEYKFTGFGGLGDFLNQQSETPAP